MATLLLKTVTVTVTKLKRPAKRRTKMSTTVSFLVSKLDFQNPTDHYADLAYFLMILIKVLK